ncbi:hypothetical protein GOV06_01030 [Candidatus Woesearchaeota archaeon]|nr:hypothetical protein [Candidatus Woesearchaeota archaeon]
MGLKEKYQKLSKEHKLPSFEELDKEFEISKIEDEKFLLREVRRKIIEKIELYAKFLEEILNPDTTISNMHEAKIFNEEERERIFEFYKKLMYYDRLSIEVSIDEDDSKSSDYITGFYKEWSELKKEFSNFVKKAKESWLKDSNIKQESGYMG